MADSVIRLYGTSRNVLMTIRCDSDADARWLADQLLGSRYGNDEVVEIEVPMPDESEEQRVPLTATEQRVWDLWGKLSDDEPSPVKLIARELGMTPADVAFIVYPVEEFGRWEDDQEPELP